MAQAPCAVRGCRNSNTLLTSAVPTLFCTDMAELREIQREGGVSEQGTPLGRVVVAPMPKRSSRRCGAERHRGAGLLVGRACPRWKRGALLPCPCPAAATGGTSSQMWRRQEGWGRCAEPICLSLYYFLHYAQRPVCPPARWSLRSISEWGQSPQAPIMKIKR